MCKNLIINNRMPKILNFAPLPLYSIATYKNFIYFSGGGGGKTGIPNQILIYNRSITKQPVNRISTGYSLYENMCVSIEHELMVCSANEKLIVFEVRENGKQLNKLYEIEVDQSLKNATINSICFCFGQPIVAAGGDDSHVRFYSISKDKQPVYLWEHLEHRQPVRKIDAKEGSLFVSTDTQVAVIVSLNKKQTLRKFYRDQLNPVGSLLQSSYFYDIKNEKDLNLIICHYKPRHESYVTRELDNSQYMTLQVSKDQSCATSKQGKYLGLACGGGETYIIDVERMTCVGRKKGHEAVITAGIMTKGKRFITGTSSCSYLVQEQEQIGSLNWLYALILTLIIMIIIGLGVGQMGQQL